MTTISVCMIVKNEAENLGACLDCLTGISDEIIIVDTGSSDQTKEIAALYTKLIYDFAWTGDFSDARNFAFSLASMEYVYSADADERIDQENQIRFKILKSALVPEVEIVQMKYANQLEKGGVYNFDMEYRPKLFRRLRSFRWISPIHETVALTPVVFDSDVIIGHFPKVMHVERDFAAFVRAAQKSPLDARLHHMYATELYKVGDVDAFQQAIPYFEASLLDDARSFQEIGDARCILVRGARLLDRESMFYKHVLHGVVGVPPAEICCEIAQFYFDRNDFEEAFAWYYTAAHGAQSNLDVCTCGVVPLQGLATCCSGIGQSEQAAIWEAKARAWSPNELLGD